MEGPATEILSSAAAVLDRLIRTRRSWKPAAMDPARDVPRPLVERLLANAGWAPTHGLTEPWRFHVFTGAARARLAAELPRVYDEVTPSAEVRPEKRAKLGVVFGQAPVVIALACAHTPGGKIPEIEDLLAVACAVQNLHLSAHAAGLAGMWSSPPLVYADAVKPVLDLGPQERCLGFFFLGWPQPGAPVPTSRRAPLGEKVRWFEQ